MLLIFVVTCFNSFIISAMRRNSKDGRINRNNDAIYYHSNHRNTFGEFDPQQLTTFNCKEMCNEAAQEDTANEQDMDIIYLDDSSSEESQTLNNLWNHASNLQSDLALVKDIDRDLRLFVKKNNLQKCTDLYDQLQEDNGCNNNLTVKQTFTIINTNPFNSSSSTNDDSADLEIVQFDEDDIRFCENEIQIFEHAKMEALRMYSMMNMKTFPESNVKILELPQSEPTSPDNRTYSKIENSLFEERVPTPTPNANEVVPPLRLSVSSTLPTVTEEDKESLKSNKTSIISPTHLNNWIQKENLKCADDIGYSFEVRGDKEEKSSKKSNENLFEFERNSQKTNTLTKRSVSSQTKGIISIEVKEESDTASETSYDSHPNRFCSKKYTQTLSIQISNETYGPDIAINNETSSLVTDFDKISEGTRKVEKARFYISSSESESEFCEIYEQTTDSVWSRLINCVMCR